jgi:uncharacterized protein YfaP (DUF2135 family)
VSRRLALAVLGLALPVLASSAAADPAPAQVARVRITAPRGGQVGERVVVIRGECPGVTAARLTLVLNGVPLSIARSGETFQTEQVLAPGLNTVRVLAEEGGKVLEDSVAVHARVPAKDLRITLTWDTPATDVDLWVTGPDGEKVFYSQRQGALGGTLDTDVTTGYGPETFTLARLTPGQTLGQKGWQIQAHYYGGAAPTWVEVHVIEHEGQPDEARRTFRGLLLAVGDILEVGTLGNGG